MIRSRNVIVTGIRHGIEDAIEIKRDNGSIVEAISAEDIGKLPDTSIADSISRLPGLTSQRAEGRASAISLRGTDPGFTTALLNGREQVSTGDNRSIEFEQYPSELLSSVVIYKTPDAELIGQGLAGTIDLRTTRPLDYGRRTMAFNMRGERTRTTTSAPTRTTRAIARASPTSTSSSTTRLGVTFGFARLVSPLATRGAGTYEPWHANGTPGAGDNNPTASSIRALDRTCSSPTASRFARTWARTSATARWPRCNGGPATPSPASSTCTTHGASRKTTRAASR